MNASDTPGGETPPDPQFSRSDRPAEGFFGWIRGLGFSRAQDRWFAGVASGIAAKIGIDPLIVRGIFVVLAILGGPGILLYLAGWLLMPDHTGRIHLEDIVRGRASTGVLITAVVLAAVVVLPVLLRILGLPFGGFALWDVWGMPDWIAALFAVLWWTAIIGGTIWLIVWIFTRGPGSKTGGGQAPTPPATPHSGAPQASSPQTGAPETGSPQPGSPQPEGAPGVTEAPDQPRDWEAWSQNVSDRAAAWGQNVGERASAWSDRVTAEAQARHEARKLSAGFVLLSLALALLAGGTTVAAILGGWFGSSFGGAGIDTGTALVFGAVIALAVVGLAVVVAGARGKDGGWLSFASLCGVVALLFTAVFPAGATFQPFGDYTVAVTDRDEPSGVTMIAGNATVDLRGLDGEEGSTHTEVWLLAGQTRVQLPEDRPTIVDVRILAGNVGESRTDVEGGRTSGPLIHRTITANMDGRTGTEARSNADDDVARVSVKLAFGNVRVGDHLITDLSAGRNSEEAQR